jgi:NTE family protein
MSTDEDDRRPRIGLALGGGGARGWAHIGAIRALEEVGLRPSIVAGTSMGAAVGAAYAAGQLDAFEAWARKLERRTVLGLFDFSFRGGLIEASRVFDELAEILPDGDIESLPMAFGATATDLERGTETWFTAGPLRDALRASIAIPGLIQPKRMGSRWYVDGGLLDPVPIGLARALGAEAVIAVELSANEAEAFPLRPKPSPTEPDSHPSIPPESEPRAPGRSERDFFDALADVSDRFWSSLFPSPQTPEPDRRPSVYEVIGKSLQIMQTRITRSLLAGNPPELHVVPRLQKVGLMEFERAEEAIKEGHRAVRVALAAQQDFHFSD